MPVQKSRKTPSKRGMHRSHDGLERAGVVGRSDLGRNALASSHHAGRFLSRQESHREPRQVRLRIDLALIAPRQRSFLPARSLAIISRPITIAVDAMGGDHGPSVTVPASLDALRRDDDLRIVLVGLGELNPQPDAQRRAHSAIASLVREATQVVAMDEKPQDALRKKKDSSMRVAIDLVKAGAADACVSAGNTGALMATGRFVLKTIEGIDRPAIISRIRARHGHTHMLDLGANSECTAEHLFQFAVMGSVVASDMHGIAQAAHRRPQHRRRGDQGRQRGAGSGATAARRASSTTSASSRATTSSPARSTSW